MQTPLLKNMRFGKKNGDATVSYAFENAIFHAFRFADMMGRPIKDGNIRMSRTPFR